MKTNLKYFVILLLFFVSCSVKDSGQLLGIRNITNDTILVDYNTTTHNGLITIPFIFEETSNKPIVNSVTIFDSCYPNIDILPLLTNEDLKSIINNLDIYKINNGDTIKLDIDCYDINNWNLDEIVDDEIRNYDYFLIIDKNSD